ncbi:MAG: DHA2 family efflux MFS transporter permease subunit [Alphaproteobacteria bacterium]|jgi:DHA2 family multidrug resistance protein|nr:DHA2 family efflux MFS transporter permease subunit [Alphaproteobacteria bacterium]
MVSRRDIENRVPITLSLILATVMNSLDTTIVNVALPHIQGSVSASQDQITWVLTSYLIATAIMTPLSGWLSLRVGRKSLFMISVVGFTVASMLCGIATNLGEIVVFRLIQGLFGASLVPLSQAVVLDLYPPQQVGQVMALWGAATILGPVLGPTLGGWLTDNLSWRWCFYINLPVGILAFTGLFLFMSAERGEDKPRPFDFIGFGALTTAVASFQLMVDRGPTQDWFSSQEIWTEAIIAAIAFWVFLVQTLTARHPFFNRALARDGNFVTCTVFGFFVGVLLFSAMALLPPMMQDLMGYSAFQSGLANMPRGIGSMISMLVVGRLIGKVDTRLILVVGLSVGALAMGMMAGFSLDMTAGPIMFSGFLSGLGLGLIFVPLSTLAFATIPPTLRPEGAGMYNLVRNLGSSVGISIMQALWTSNTSVVHSTLAARIVPSNPVISAALPRALSLTSPMGAEALNGEITRQAAMVAYVDDFKVMMIISIAVMPLLVFMRTAKMAERPSAQHMAME